MSAKPHGPQICWRPGHESAECRRFRQTVTLRRATRPKFPPLVYEPTWNLPRGWLTAQDGAV